MSDPAPDPLTTWLDRIAAAAPRDRRDLRVACAYSLSDDYKNDERFVRVWLDVAAVPGRRGTSPETFVEHNASPRRRGG